MTTPCSDAAQLAQMLTVVAENFGAELSEARLQMLINELAKLPLANVRHGLTVILRTRKYAGFPTLAEILEACGAGPGGEHAAALAEAERQWLLAQTHQPPAAPYHRVIVGWDGDNQPVYADPAPSGLSPEGKAALKAIGGVTSGDMRWARKDFIEAYCRFKAQGVPQITGAAPKLRALAGGVKRIGQMEVA